MNFSSNKEKGNAGLSMAIAYFGSNWYTVSLPLNDTQDYDLIADKDGILYKVQCKATNQKNKTNNNYKLMLSSSGGTSGKVYKTIRDTEIDLLFALRGDGVMYVIPKKYIENGRQLTLSTTKPLKFSKSSVLDTSQFIVKF